MYQYDAQMKDLMEEDEECENCEIEKNENLQKQASLSNGNEFFSKTDTTDANSNEHNNHSNKVVTASKHEQPQNLLINCLSDLKTETCI
jgi:hypothetical protein